MNYSDYRHLAFDLKPNGVLLITLNRPEVLNATNARLHWELTQVWLTVDADPKVRVALVTGAGKAFSAGGDLEMVEANARDPRRLARTVRGPSMSATAGKVVIDGTVDVGGVDMFALRFLQARDPDWVGRPFFARFDAGATWLDQLVPAGAGWPGALT